ncbi:hypothetical protein LIER_03685 [Lithospermum erythrorhizon]|uniref:Uncharacterized protein n=1 Tax=Lithospermum erythrorhizon TaxID=34254 RepID=A0AAV3NU33_LITER
MEGEVRTKYSPLDDETFRIAYAERKNCLAFDYTTVFVGLTENLKFIDVYFVNPGNTDLLLDMEDENRNIKISDWSSEFLKEVDEKAKLGAERASVGVVEFNLLEEEDTDSASDSDIGDVQETEAMNLAVEENMENDESDSDSEYDEESEEDDDGSDSE